MSLAEGEIFLPAAGGENFAVCPLDKFVLIFASFISGREARRAARWRMPTGAIVDRRLRQIVEKWEKVNVQKKSER